MIFLPTELIEIIFKYLDIRDLRILNKINEFSHLKILLNKKINKSLEESKSFYNILFINNTIINLKKELDYILVNYSLNKYKWNIRLQNQQYDKIQFYNSYLYLLKNNGNIVSLINKYKYINTCLITKYNFLIIPLKPIFKVISNYL